MSAIEALATPAPETVEAHLTAPSDADPNTPALERVATDFVPHFKDYLVQKKEYTKQFYQVYQARVRALYDRVAENAKDKWIHEAGENENKANGGDQLSLCRSVLDLRPAVESIVVGTLFKEMKLRPNLIEAYAQDANTQHHIDLASYVGDNDALYIEDESGRVRLCGPVVEAKVNGLVSGIVCGVKGTPNDKGDLVVDGFCFSALASQSAPLKLKKNDGEPDKYIAFISGIKAGDSPSSNMMADLAFDYISGMLGGQVDAELASKVVRVVVAGDSVVTPKEETMKYAESIGKTTKGNKQQSVLALEEFDVMLSQLAAQVPVDIMPGANDPANYLMPQQPLYRHLFPQSARYSTTVFTTNPYHAEVGGVDIMGTSGQNVDDIGKVTAGMSGLERLRATLEWQHIAPTAPDTLSAFPFYEEDPFVIQHTPHLYFAGNQEEFETEVLTGPGDVSCRLVCVPDFSKTRTIVLVNVNTMACHPVTFSSEGGIEGTNAV